MNALKHILFLILFLTIVIVKAQDYETILWEENKKLSWEDFRGIPPKSSVAAAITGSGITYKFSSYYKNGKQRVKFTVSTFFYPNSSWYRPHLCNDLILGHEQLHFDITEIYARKMRKQLDRTSFSKNIKAEVRAIYKKINKELNDFQNLYDTSTNYSRNEEQQIIWNKKIANELKINKYLPNK